MPSSLPPSSPPPASSSPQKPQDASDPFGFFAVERHLKQQRAQARPPLADLPLKHDNPPQPATPRKPHPRRGAPSSAFFPQSPDGTPSVLDSPSPMKPPVKKPNPTKKDKGKGKAAVLSPSAHDSAEASGSAGTGARRSQRQRASKASHPAFGQPRRRSTRTAKKVQHTDDDDEQKENAHSNKRKKPAKARPTPAPRARRDKDDTKPARKAANDVDPEQQEKWERERQERLEYFKRLEGYQVAKENVYVV